MLQFLEHKHILDTSNNKDNINIYKEIGQLISSPNSCANKNEKKKKKRQLAYDRIEYADLTIRLTMTNE